MSCGLLESMLKQLAVLWDMVSVLICTRDFGILWALVAGATQSIRAFIFHPIHFWISWCHAARRFYMIGFWFRCFTGRELVRSTALRPGMPNATAVFSVMFFTTTMSPALRRYAWCSRRQALLCSPQHRANAESLTIYFVSEPEHFLVQPGYVVASFGLLCAYKKCTVDKSCRGQHCHSCRRQPLQQNSFLQ